MLQNRQVFRGLIDEAACAVFKVAESAHGLGGSEFCASLVRNVVREINPGKNLLLDGEALPLAQNTAIFDAGARCQMLCCTRGQLSFAKIAAKIARGPTRPSDQFAQDTLAFQSIIDIVSDTYSNRLANEVGDVAHDDHAQRTSARTRKRRARSQETSDATLISAEQGVASMAARTSLLRALADALSELQSTDPEFVATLDALRAAIASSEKAIEAVQEYSLATEKAMDSLPDVCKGVEGPFAGGEILSPLDNRLRHLLKNGCILLPQRPGTLVDRQLQHAVFAARNALTAPWPHIADDIFKKIGDTTHGTMSVAALCRRTSLLALAELLVGQLDVAIHRNEEALDLFKTRRIGNGPESVGFIEHARRWFVDPARLMFYATADGNRAAVVDVDWCDGEFLVRDQVLNQTPWDSDHTRAVKSIVANVAYVALWSVGVEHAREIAVESEEASSLEVAELLCSYRHMPRGMFAFADVPTPPDLLCVCAEMLAHPTDYRPMLVTWKRRLRDAFSTLAGCIESNYSVRACDFGTASALDFPYEKSNSRVTELRNQWQQVCSPARLMAMKLKGSINSPTFSGAFSRGQVLFIEPRLKHLYDHGGISSSGLASALTRASSDTLCAFAQMMRRQGLTADVLGMARGVITSSGVEEVVPVCVDCTFHGEPSLGEGVTRTIAESVIREYASHQCALLCISATSNIVELSPAPPVRSGTCKQCSELCGIDKGLPRELLLGAAVVALSFYIQMPTDRFGPFMIGPLLAAALSRVPFSARTLAPLFYACHPTKLLSALARTYLSEGDADGPSTVTGKFADNYRRAFERVRDCAPCFMKEVANTAYTLDMVGGLMYRFNGVAPSELVGMAELDSFENLPIEDLRVVLLSVFDFPSGHWRVATAFGKLESATRALINGVTGVVGTTIDISEYMNVSSRVVDGNEVSRISFTPKFDRFISTRLSIRRQQARDASQSTIALDPMLIDFNKALTTVIERLEVERARLFTTHFVLTESREILMQLYETITGEKSISGRTMLRISNDGTMVKALEDIRGVCECIMRECATGGGHVEERKDYEARAWTCSLMRCDALANRLHKLHSAVGDGADSILVRMSSLGSSGEDVLFLDTVSTCERSWRQAAWPTYEIYRERMDLLLAQRLHFTNDELQNTVYDT